MDDRPLEELIDQLAEAGRVGHGLVCDYGEAMQCGAEHVPPEPCQCGADEHNAAVERHLAAIKAKLADMRLDAQGDAFDRDRG